MKKITIAFAATALAVITLAITGCWTPPNANVQPAGQPGLIQSEIPVELIQEPVMVTTIDAGQRTITLKQANNDSRKTFNVSEKVKNFDQVKIGDILKATVKAELSVYILDDGRLANADGTSHLKTINFNAKVLQVDPSYRILTLQFINGHTITIKTGLNVMLDKMAPGDDVIMRSHEVTALEIKKP